MKELPATLLLRMAGVPSRMVTGFATGVRTERGYMARDVDAHAWIEMEGHDIGPPPGKGDHEELARYA